MGAGAIGCYVGGRLASGCDVRLTFVGRQRLGDAVGQYGLSWRGLDGREGTETVDFATDAAALEDCDVVLVCVKSGATREVARDLAAVLKPGTSVVSLQNGVRNPALLKAELVDQVVHRGIVSFNVVWTEPDGRPTFHQATSGPLQLEINDEPAFVAVVEAMRVAGLAVDLYRDLEAEQYTKLLVNLSNAVGALSGVPTRDLLADRAWRQISASLISEALGVLRVAGIDVARFRGVPVRVMTWILPLPTMIVQPILSAQLRVDPVARSSMWQDLEWGRVTEVDFLNGEIVRIADQAGVEAPLNRGIVALIREAERAEAGSPGLTAKALIGALNGRSSMVDDGGLV